MLPRRSSSVCILMAAFKRGSAPKETATNTNRELRKGHGEKLIPARKPPDAILASVTRHPTPKFVSGNEIHQLRKTVLSEFISHPSWSKGCGKGPPEFKSKTRVVAAKVIFANCL